MALLDLISNCVLWLPLDVVLVLVALATALILTLVRKKTTNQDLLHRCRDDKRRLKELIRQAKRAGDKEAIVRYRASIGQIGLKTMKAEFLPLLVSLLPIGALAIWCYAHLGFHPPAAGEPIVVSAWFTPGAIGEPTMLVPAEGLKLVAADGPTENLSWLKRIEPWHNQAAAQVQSASSQVSKPSITLATLTSAAPADEADLRSTTTVQPVAAPRGVAQWTIAADRADAAYQLTVRHRGKTYELPLLVGQRTYSPPEVSDDTAPLRRLEVSLRPYKPFGVVPGYAPLGLDRWLIGYLILAVPLAFAARWFLDVC